MTAQDHHPDPLSVAVVGHKLRCIAEEVVDTMIRTCFSPLLNQSHDFSAVILDSGGRLLAQAERVPIHMGAMPFAVKAMAEAFAGDIADGDVLMANDPYYGGSHLPDVTLAKPVFSHGRLRLWVSNRAHQGDIGGLSAGGYSPGAREIFHEGLRIPPVKLVDRGQVREDLLRLVAENTRKPDDITGDIRAQMSSVAVGADRCRLLFDRYGADRIELCAEGILDTAEATMRAQLRRWKSGSWDGVGYLDDDGWGNTMIPIRAHVTLKGDEVEVDLSDSADQSPSIMNSPIANTCAAVYGAFMYLADDEQIHNEGCFRCIQVITREGSICHPRPPAPVVGSTTLTAGVIMEAVIKAMEEAAPDSIIGGYCRRFRYVIAGQDRRGRSYIWHYFFNRGGGGACRDADGWTNIGVMHNPGGIRAPSVERTESSFPFVIERYAIRPDSGGPGASRGGLGGILELRYDGEEPATLNATGEGVHVAPFGIAGGHDALANDFRIRQGDGERPLGSKETDVVLMPGDVVVSEAAGGGGYGDPRQRDRAKVAKDVKEGLVSERAARDIYESKR